MLMVEEYVSKISLCLHRLHSALVKNRKREREFKLGEAFKRQR